MSKLEIEIQPEEDVRLQNLARDKGLTLAEYVRQALLEHVRQALLEQGVDKKVIFPSDTEREPIWKKTDRIARRIPKETRSAVPTDGAQNYKHYLYGKGSASE